MITSYSGTGDIVNSVDGNQETMLHRQVSYLPFCVQIFSLPVLNYILLEVRIYVSAILQFKIKE